MVELATRKFKKVVDLYGIFRQEHPIASRTAETVAAAGLLYTGAIIWERYRGESTKPEIPIIKVPEEKWEETGLVHWLGIPFEEEGYAIIRNDLSKLEELATTLYLNRRVRTGKSWLSFSADLPHPIATFAAIRKKVSLHKYPKLNR